MAPSGVFEGGADEQAVDHAVLLRPIHQPHGLHDLTVMDDETMDWLLNTCPEIEFEISVGCNNSFKRRRRSNLR